METWRLRAPSQIPRGFAKAPTHRKPVRLARVAATQANNIPTLTRSDLRPRRNGQESLWNSAAHFATTNSERVRKPRHAIEAGVHAVTCSDRAPLLLLLHRSAKLQCDFYGSMEKPRGILAYAERETFSGSMAITRALTQATRRPRQKTSGPCGR